MPIVSALLWILTNGCNSRHYGHLFERLQYKVNKSVTLQSLLLLIWHFCYQD
jgi:hypothetical protein